MSIQVSAEVEHIEYEPTLCSDLPDFSMDDVLSGEAINETGKFSLTFDNGDTIGVSTWVTPKRTRSYPYARVYDTLQYSTRVAIIPVVKDEGRDGDRDYLQWDTVSLMSLLNVYVIPAYYHDAEAKDDYDNKIESQKFDPEYIYEKIRDLKSYQGDALHWNMRELGRIGEISGKIKRNYYEKISPDTGVEMHGKESFERKMSEMADKIDEFKSTSRELAREAQQREASSDQPTENTIYEKGEVTLRNFLGGEYHFTVDELFFVDGDAVFAEKKHTRSTLPSESDIKDGLLKLALYLNITESGASNTHGCIGLTGEDFPNICTHPDDLDDSLSETYTTRFKRVYDECISNDLLFFAAPKDISEDEQYRIVREQIRNMD